MPQLGNRFEVTVERPNQIRSGDGAWLDLVLANNACAPLEVPIIGGTWDDGELYYDLSVTSDKGKLVPRPIGWAQRRQNHIVAGSESPEKIQPGKTLRLRVALTKLFDLTGPGSYVVRATAKMAGVRQSGKIAITVIPIDPIPPTCWVNCHPAPESSASHVYPGPDSRRPPR